MNTIRFFYFLIPALLLISCGSDDGGSSNPTPATAGDISGSVNLYDSGTTQLSGADMTITVEGTSPLITTTTDANGEFTLSEVPFGTYTIAYSKTGYGTFKQFNIAHNNENGTSITVAPSLGQLSPTEVLSVDITINTNEVEIEKSLDPPASSNDRRYFRIFFGSDDTVSNTNFVAVAPTLETGSEPSTTTYSVSELMDLGLQSGSTVFVRVYGDSFFGNSYNDPGLGREVFPNLNANSASPVSFVVP
ncbi:carboxypeptidase-like regulatory domain-containing protein [Poritiphilus flavus]|uniref:Carboxypeptidase regulatory-like domain-containing protein n=1 Tax=Poritiphilus flavus TaxID=2697053 RepID=A0A6L9EG38_9FLAO|nr:carboxypeptidase-like regulatory domain-containing protein [Poritiphilus flavus]NAS13488.1 carboxypeptidase regulatory-like domain-containing protein [Poritiphilus flavus]